MHYTPLSTPKRCLKAPSDLGTHTGAIMKSIIFNVVI